jgi:hypothetical protein
MPTDAVAFGDDIGSLCLTIPSVATSPGDVRREPSRRRADIRAVPTSASRQTTNNGVSPAQESA